MLRKPLLLPLQGGRAFRRWGCKGGPSLETVEMKHRFTAFGFFILERMRAQDSSWEKEWDLEIALSFRKGRTGPEAKKRCSALDFRKVFVFLIKMGGNFSHWSFASSSSYVIWSWSNYFLQLQGKTEELQICLRWYGWASQQLSPTFCSVKEKYVFIPWLI